MSKRKILVLVMSCNQKHFVDGEAVVRETWAKPILEGEYENIDFYSYTGGNDKQYVNKDEHRVYCMSGDGIYETHQKTVECIALLLKNGIDFDYIFRTNTSTVTNVGLLDAFVNTIEDDSVVWGGELYSIGVPCPFSDSLYIRGNSIILSKKLCGIILDWTKYLRIPRIYFADDNLIGNILNTYHILRFEDYRNFIKSYGFAWYKSEKNYNPKLNNGCSDWSNTNTDYDYLKNFISIQIKIYGDRTEEFDNMRLISSIVNVKKEYYDDEFNFIKKFSNNPTFFINNTRKGIREYRFLQKLKGS